MSTILVLILMICALCFSGAAFGYRFERVLPVSCMGIVAVLFLFGMVGLLGAGVYIIILVSAVAVVFFVFRSLKRGYLSKVISRSFTPAFFCFLLTAAAIVYFCYGKMAYMWDELDHWMYVVKAMSILDDFGTAPAAHDWFASYPPGMALMQYLTVKLDMLLHGGNIFNEWLCYFSYHLFTVSLLFPLFEGFSFRKIWKMLLCVGAVEMLSAIFFRQAFIGIYIDPFIGIAAGAGFLAIIFRRNDDILHRLYICLICVMLVLAKDIGMFSGAAVSAAYFFDSFDMNALRVSKGENKRAAIKNVTFSLLPFLSMLCAKGLWTLELLISGTERQFSEDVNYLYYAKIFFFGGDDTYYQDVADRYKQELIHGEFLGFGPIKISILTALLFFSVLSVLLMLVFKKRAEKIACKFSAVAVIILYAAIYIFELGAIYIYRFSEEEALAFASLWRYAAIALIPLAMVCVMLGLYAAEKAGRSLSGRFSGRMSFIIRRGLPGAAYLMIIAVMAFLTFFSVAVNGIVTRSIVAESQETRRPHEPISELISAVCEPDDKIYLIRQGENNELGSFGFYSNMIVRMNTFPVYIEESHSIGKPCYDGDIWTEDIPFEQWLDTITEKYDYVALCKIDDQISGIYGAAFDHPDSIVQNRLFKVNKDKKILEEVYPLP